MHATQAEAGDARGGRMDLLGGARRVDRMGHSSVHFVGHKVLVGVTIVRPMDLSRSSRNVG